MLLLFTAGLTRLFAGNLNLPNQQDTIPVKDSTVVPEVKAEEFIIPAGLTSKTFDFQINSAISYLSFSHFSSNESKKRFFQAWLKEKELSRLTAQTDSLRKVYSYASGRERDELARLILNNENQLMALNQEIPALYLDVRDREVRYWQSVPEEEIERFQKKISLFKDSLDLTNKKRSEPVKNPETAGRDTVTRYVTLPKAPEVKNVPDSGIIYKIQIGAYKGKLPEPANKLIKKLSVIRKIENYVDGKGVRIYTTGNLKSWSEAITMQNQVKQEGVKNALVTAYRNGKRITVNEARKINGEL